MSGRLLAGSAADSSPLQQRRRQGQKERRRQQHRPERRSAADEGSKGRRGFTRRRRSRGSGKPGDADEAKREPSGFDGLYCTDDPTLLPVCTHVLVYLNGDTHTDPVHSAALHRQLDEIIKAKHHLVLVHENRAEFNGRSFASIIESTPKALVRDESGAKRLYQASE